MELVFYPEPWARWRSVGVGALIMVVALVAMSQLIASRQPDLLWHYPLLGASGAGLVLGQLLVLSGLEQYPRLRLQGNWLWSESPFGAKATDLSLLGPAHVIQYRVKLTTFLYLAFYSLGESVARRQSGMSRSPRLSEMHTTIWLNALVGHNRRAAQSIADVVNARRPPSPGHPLTQIEIDHHLKRLRRRRRWNLAITICIAIAATLLKAVFGE